MWYFDPDSSGFYNSKIHKTIPEKAIKISEEDYFNFALKSNPENTCISISNGKLVWSQISPPSNEDLQQIERSWRNIELHRADIELYKVQDSDPKSKGSVSEWREYRKALRSWPENPNFPNKEFRPKAPDYKE